MGIKDLATQGMAAEELLDGLEPDLRAALLQALRNMSNSVFQIAFHCRDDGYEIEPRELQRWRVEHMAELV